MRALLADGVVVGETSACTRASRASERCAKSMSGGVGGKIC